MHIKVLNLVHKRQYQINANLNQLIKHYHHWSEKAVDGKKGKEKEPRKQPIGVWQEINTIDRRQGTHSIWKTTNTHSCIIGGTCRYTHRHACTHMDARSFLPSSRYDCFGLRRTIRQNDFWSTRGYWLGQWLETLHAESWITCWLWLLIIL